MAEISLLISEVLLFAYGILDEYCEENIDEEGHHILDMSDWEEMI